MAHPNGATMRRLRKAPLHALRTALLALHPGPRRIRPAGAGGGRRALRRCRARGRRHGGDGALPGLARGARGRRSRRRSWSTARWWWRRPRRSCCTSGPRLGLVARSEADALWTHQIQLTIADFVAEVHDTHHPIAVGLYYEDQQAEAQRRAAEFRKSRLPKFMAWFEAVLERNARNEGAAMPHLVGGRLSYADLSLFQLVEGLQYAFPKATRRVLKQAPLVAALHAGVATHRRLRAVPGERAADRLQRAGHLPALPGTGRLSRRQRAAVGFRNAFSSACAKGLEAPAPTNASLPCLRPIAAAATYARAWLPHATPVPLPAPLRPSCGSSPRQPGRIVSNTSPAPLAAATRRGRAGLRLRGLSGPPGHCAHLDQPQGPRIAPARCRGSFLAQHVRHIAARPPARPLVARGGGAVRHGLRRAHQPVGGPARGDPAAGGAPARASGRRKRAAGHRPLARPRSGPWPRTCSACTACWPAPSRRIPSPSPT